MRIYGQMSWQCPHFVIYSPDPSLSFYALNGRALNDNFQATPLYRQPLYIANPFETAERKAFRETMRNFVEKEIAPFAYAWDEAGQAICVAIG